MTLPRYLYLFALLISLAGMAQKGDTLVCKSLDTSDLILEHYRPLEVMG